LLTFFNIWKYSEKIKIDKGSKNLKK
jgi:hypothetical protein